MNIEARGEHLTADAMPFGWLGTRRERYLVSVFWLLSLAEPLTTLLHHHPTPLQIGSAVAGVIPFGAVYLWMTFTRIPAQGTIAPSLRGRLWGGLAILMAIAVGLALLDGPTWLLLVVFAGVRVGAAPPSIWPATRLIWALVGTVFALGMLLGLDWYSAFIFALFVIAAGFTSAARARLLAAITALQAAQREIARLAADAERLRVARDLHDLLGHTLSLLVLKSELAGRLVTRDPERAEAEIHEVENISRTALREVREAVAGYRQPTLASELHAARELLAAAGIEATFAGALSGGSAAPHLPTRVEAVLSWAVREGVTNVIRHSRARWCRIHVNETADAVCLTITDGGQTPPVPAASSSAAPGVPPGDGSGLAGLRERARRLGGICEAGPEPRGGFRLAVRLPLAGTGAAQLAPATAHAAASSGEGEP